MSDDFELDVVTKDDIDPEDQVVKLTNEDIEEYYAAVPAEELPDPYKLENDVMSLLEYLGTDEAVAIQKGCENKSLFKHKLKEIYTSEATGAIIDYVMDGRPIEDLMKTINAFKQIKSGRAYDDVHKELQYEMKQKYVPQEFLDIEDKYKDTPTDVVEHNPKHKKYEDLDRRSRRRIDRLRKKRQKHQ
jgi:hypothetical protein